MDLVRAIRNVSRRGLLELANIATGGLQSLRVRLGQEVQTIGHFQPYGLESVPLPGAEVLVASINGAPSLGTGLVTDRRMRSRDLQAGEVALHNPTGTTRVRLGLGGVVEIKAGASRFVLTPVGFTISAGAMVVTGTPAAMVLQDGLGDMVTLSPALCELRHVSGAAVSATPAGIVATDAAGDLLTLTPALASIALSSGNAVAITPAGIDLLTTGFARLNGQQIAVV